MRFERLEVQNFACFHGTHELDLTCCGDRSVTIVVGGNGCGKTSLFDALNWALYGGTYELELRKSRQRQLIDYVNEQALHAAGTNGRVEMSATLHFEHEDKHYYVSHAMAVRVSSVNGKLACAEDERSNRLVEVLANGNHRKLEFDTIFLNEALPSNVRDYFLFDGDRIHQLSNPGASQEVRDAIYRVVDLELLRNASEHLAEVATQYRREAKREGGANTAELEERYQKAWDRQSHFKRVIEEKKDEREKVDAHLEALRVKLRNLPDTRALQERRDQLAERYRESIERYERNAVQMRSSAGTGILSLADDALRALDAALDGMREKGRIPKNVSTSLLEDLLHLKRCLCGEVFAVGDPRHAALVRRLEAERRGPTGQELLTLLYATHTAREDIGAARRRLSDLDGEQDGVREKQRELDLAVKQAEQELAKLPMEDVADLYRQEKEAGRDRDGIIRALQQAEDSLKQCEALIKKLAREREEAARQNQKARAIYLRERLAQQASGMLEQLHETVAEDSRKAVEEMTREEFQRFVRSSSHYTVGLTEDYELEVLDSNGNRALQRLSMGQSQCLSLAFITAISRVSEKNPPFVIDMPFGRLDRDVHDTVSRRLPDITSQLVLFLLPGSEWHDGTQTNLEPRLCHLYNLDFDAPTRESTIRKVR